MGIGKSSEDYLEAILMITQERGTAHSVEVAQMLHFSKASVSVAIKKLRENGYVDMKPDGALVLLPPGQEIAEHVYDRHKLLSDYFMKLGVDKDTAVHDACLIEHDLSDETYQKLKQKILSEME